MKPIRTLIQVTKTETVRASFKPLARDKIVRVKAKGKIPLRVARESDTSFTCFPNETMKRGGRTCTGKTPAQAFARAVAHYW